MAFRQSGILLALLSGAALVAAASAPSRAADELRIGLIAPMTGPFAQVGKDMVDGINMYLEENKGEFAGAKVKLIVEDDRPSRTPASPRRRSSSSRTRCRCWSAACWPRPAMRLRR